ncbi:retrovirus-related protein [Rhizophagus clarus]|uniref:Retrovirus-related protein n=1 Tax=Rhizophagus clarus TaxID=94130 RepID=A0A8H3R2K0_9GLOM|nr:retrovirus-related protein [Rhizophagus clarus]
MKIFNVYIKSKVTSADGQLIADLQAKLTTNLQFNDDQDIHSIVLGDFNLSYEKYQQKLLQGKSPSSQEAIFDKLDNEFYFVDVTALLEPDASKITTFDAAVGSSHHKLVSASLLMPTLSQHRSPTNHKTVFNFKDMSTEQWDEYQKYVELRFAHYNDKLNPTEVNSKWTSIKLAIQDASRYKNAENEYLIPQRTYSFRGSQRIHFSPLYEKLRTILKCIKACRKALKRPSYEFPDLYKESVEIALSYDTTLTVPFASDSTFNVIKLMELKDILTIEYNNDLRESQLQKIKEATITRESNLDGNQGKVIKSVMEHEVRSIVLDKVIDTDPTTNVDVLLTNPKDIKRKVNDHFQHAAQSVNEPKTIPREWSDIFEPKHDIDASIYDELMTPSSLEELEAHIHKLPLGKAAGPSRIHNEFIKHLPVSLKIALLDLINDIFLHQQFPDADENRKELWILALDMSKAYDRVNVHLLETAMARLKLPSSFIRFVLGLFTNRKNSVFTAYGNTTPYDVLTGIDQGEVISPLLWCIYFDPLLTKLEQLQKGYKISDGSTSIHVPSKAYMDDTTIITDSKENLEVLLTTADSFFELASIKINYDKVELLLRSDSAYDASPINLSFGDKSILIVPKPPKENIRILGVYFNVARCPKYNLRLIRDEIINFTSMIKKKDVTDKIIRYIFNSLIIPRIEYRSQVQVLTKDECNSFKALYMKTIKNKLGFAATAPNIIITNSFFYGLIDLYQRQLEEKITSFMIQINNPGLLGTITNLRLNNIQHALSLPRSPLFGLTTDDFTQYRRFKTQKQLMKRVKKSHLVNLIFLLQEHELSISESPPQIPSRDDNISISFNFERGTNNNTLKPIFAAIDDHDRVSFHAFKRLLPSNQSLATTNHLIPDLTTPSNSITEFDFCPGCDRDISVTRDSRYTRCSDRFATNDIIPIPNSVTVWNRSSKHNVDSRSYANDSMENILQYLRRLHDLKGTYTPSDLIQIYFHDNSIRSRLLEICSQLRDSKQVNYTAYTDGSLQHLGSNDITMTYGFILVDDASNETRFKSSISHWPSSTRAEIMAVVTTLLVLPRNSHITIHTDSQATIDGFYSHITTIKW